MKKKVAVISNMYPTEQHKSFGIFVKNQVVELQKKELEVDVIAIDNPNKGKVNLIKKYGKWMLSFLFHLLLKGRHTSVVHAHYVFPSGWLARWYKKLFGARFVVTAHGGDIDKMAKLNPRIRSLTKQVLQDADHVIAVGQDLYDTLHGEFGVEKEKLSLINMGVNLDVFHKVEKSHAREMCGIDRNIVPLLFVGNITEPKGLLELLPAFEQLKQDFPQVELYLLGSEKDAGFTNMLKGYIKEKDLQDSVHFVGTMPQKDVAMWMAAAEVFVIPSHIEGFGLVALEAMACGTPVVGAKVGGLKYLLDDGCGIAVEAKNSEDLYHGLKTVFASEDVKTNLISNGLARAVENDHEIMTKRVISIYNGERLQEGNIV
ncbi:glycosyltransferase family 4 protein [Bacillus timonensis]|nr:glycosyltransferase family 4 protein [Bacillus timonensis]